MVIAMRFLPLRAGRRSPRALADSAQENVAALTGLTYELLDAHADTARLAGDGPVATQAEWENHLAYLRDLQRVARETLARAVAVDGDRPRESRGRRRSRSRSRPRVASSGAAGSGQRAVGGLSAP
jgi:hypothetical protein